MQFKKAPVFVLCALLIGIFAISSCRKQQLLTTGGVLTFSTDSLKFDTVFTAAGSFTSGLLIYNTQNAPIEISSVRLQSGAASYFHLNVDGFAGNNITNLRVAAHDSIYVFATVNIDPTIKTTPFLITDKLIATLNGKDFSMVFTAYGQNAHYIVSDSFSATSTTWDTVLPYVVLHQCVIGPNATLNIPARCKVYMHQDARFFVYGKFNVDTASTTASDTVVFQGDRLDRAYFGYQGYPGEWGGVYVVNGGSARINNAIFKNCGGPTPYYYYPIQGAAIEVDSGGSLVMTNSVITNSFGHGIFGFEGNVTATNCLVNYCGGNALAIALGGKYSFTNCTFADYSDYAVSHISNPTMGIVNYLQVSQDVYVYASLDAAFHNCIVWGSLDSEVFCDTFGSALHGNPSVNLLFDHCVLRTATQNEPFQQMPNCVFTDPQFKNPTNNNFHIVKDSSSAFNSGNAVFTPLFDLNWNLRQGNDVGCYEHQ